MRGSAAESPFALSLDSSSDEELATIEGTVPGMFDMPRGCKFEPRCKYATERCKAERPTLEDTGNGHMVRCFNFREALERAEEAIVNG